MNKEKYLRSKMVAFEDNITAHSQEDYQKRNFESTERLIKILGKQSTIRGTQHIFHRLHTIRNL